MSRYLLGDTAAEAARLREQAASDPVEARLAWAGLRPGMRVVDAGCGPGVLARTLARLVGPEGSVRAFDLSEGLVAEARRAPPEAGAAPIVFETGDILAPPVEAGWADFAFCQYVFQFLRDPSAALAALVGMLRPGGRLLVCDGDGIGTTLWPLPPGLEADIARLLAMLAPTGFDPQAGRKLYGRVRAAGLRDVAVTIYPFRVFAGAAPQAELQAWRGRFAALAPAGAAAFGDEARWQAFCAAYLGALSDEAVLKYGVGFAVQGVRP